MEATFMDLPFILWCIYFVALPYKYHLFAKCQEHQTTLQVRKITPKIYHNCFIFAKRLHDCKI